MHRAAGSEWLCGCADPHHVHVSSKYEVTAIQATPGAVSSIGQQTAVLQ